VSKAQASQLSWESLESTSGTIWAKESEAVIPWTVLFSDFGSVFNREPEKTFAQKNKATKAHSIVLAVKDAVETRLSMPRQKKIELMLSRIGRDVTIVELAAAVSRLDTDAIDLNRQSLIQENLPTAEEIAAVRELVEKTGSTLESSQLQKKLGPAQFFVHEFSKISDLEKRTRFLHDYHVIREDSILAWKSRAESLLRASREVRTSPKLPFLFSAILQVANSFHPGGVGEASSFKLSALAKLWNSKGASGMTVEQYVVRKFLANEAISDALDLQKDLTCIDSARSVDFAKMNFEMDKLRDGVRVAQYLKEQGEHSPKIDDFIKDISTQLDGCTRVVAAAEEAFKDLCSFLGEDPLKATPGGVFGALLDFTRSVSRCQGVKRG